jgi:phosphoribosyl 1,2-cyclic phosphate phosphodiesterase
MRITFLGTGDAGGVPLYGCDCIACARARESGAYRRRNCSALIESGDTRILLDAGLTDLTERFAPGSLSAILVTHFHPDHVQGLLHLRWGKGAAIPVYAPPDSEGCADLYKNHGLLDFRKLAKFDAFSVGDLTITPLPLIHSKVTFGYAIEDRHGRRFAYLTDTAGLPPHTETFLKSWQPDGMALDCSHPPREQASRNHNDFPRALASIDAIAPARAWLTHISHEFDCWDMGTAAVLPQNVGIARDGEVVELLHRSPQGVPAC